MSEPTSQPPQHRPVSFGRSVRHHLVVVLVCLALGVVGGWLYAGTKPASWTSTARVLINPSSGNPYAPTPASVRQDQETSLATEAQIAGSREVVDEVVADTPGLQAADVQRGLDVTVPPNTQILELAFTARDASTAQSTAQAVAEAYLANRERRFEAVTAERIDRVETRTATVVEDLRAATAASQVGNAANRAFQKQLADALRNELVSLRAQRTALDNSDSPPGSVITPAGPAVGGGGLMGLLLPIGGGLAGLFAGCLLALLLERLRGVVRSARDVEAAGLPVVATIPAPRLGARLLRRHDVAAGRTAVRRLRAAILDAEPRPDVVAVATAGPTGSAGTVAEAVAESFAKAGHRVVLVDTQEGSSTGLDSDDGLAQALMHERLDVLDLLKPSVEPLLSLLPAGRTSAQSRELLVADRIRSAVAPLVETGHLVVIASPALDSADGEAVVGAADCGIVVAALGRTRVREVEEAAAQTRTRGTALAALVLDERDLAPGRLRASGSEGGERRAGRSERRGDRRAGRRSEDERGTDERGTDEGATSVAPSWTAR